MKHDLTTRVKPFDPTANNMEYIMDETLRKKMVEGNPRPFGLAVGHIAKMRNDGSTLDDADVVTPYQLHFFPNPALRAVTWMMMKSSMQTGNRSPGSNTCRMSTSQMMALEVPSTKSWLKPDRSRRMNRLKSCVRNYTWFNNCRD